LSRALKFYKKRRGCLCFIWHVSVHISTLLLIFLLPEEDADAADAAPASDENEDEAAHTVRNFIINSELFKFNKP
jgi:hypothetical protein